MNTSDTSPETITVDDSDTPEVGTAGAEPNTSMQEYYKLQQELYVITLTITGIIFVFVWVFYSLNIALNYLIGATTSVVYLRMLAKEVESIGGDKRSVGKTRLAIFVGLMILATQLNQLKILPIFLGFLTYKAALIIYVVRTSLMPNS
ncbi:MULTISPECIES: ATP synthase subunit I [Okeania]|uniref:ATP synthase subunit I n=1 Tax=Okeania hirsuta TaxID=1458930 RepID=A0A3N6RAB9_9CYAN|nr:MULTISPECIES: ATP synthase subunit I [Okeania]NES75838.1 ATP synthase subunit I [Okeania sp. SIO1H4]NES92769.1 ATP synthase subunit I [Okeania sp. SIO2B9]NET20022.1 ATP synthase subunit I [Okeania sp. SIO1H5]NET75532.1 ATP synthase subunit I [Okeania sp. SIO1F9]NET91856.1 ATP synthase subunit I [Okeania sp. SIO1H2]